jgi:hypothetical protein
LHFHFEDDGAAPLHADSTSRVNQDAPELATRPSVSANLVASPPPLPVLVIAAHAEWFQIDGGPVVTLETRLALRKLLLALGVARMKDGRGALSSTEAFNAGWPGERAHPNAASVRVYTAIHTLRSLGLRAILVRRNGGYTLEAKVNIAANVSQFPSALPEGELESEEEDRALA